ncbi:hypothetical protein DFH06DRAFT_987051 [Mycena polygramma]|nr:hypothetical protein DFH06DRAFT_987051 [Mycena polygramma]
MSTRRNNPGNNLHVSGLSHKIDTRDLEAAFAKTGRVKKASVMFDPHTRESRGFGFVTMETPEEADAAIAALNGMELGGKSINVEKVCLCFRVSTNFPTYITRSPPFLLSYGSRYSHSQLTPLHSTTYTRTVIPLYLPSILTILLTPPAFFCRYVCIPTLCLPPPYSYYRAFICRYLRLLTYHLVHTTSTPSTYPSLALSSFLPPYPSSPPCVTRPPSSFRTTYTSYRSCLSIRRLTGVPSSPTHARPASFT